jgi:dihydrolipoamide dehydrogenase
MSGTTKVDLAVLGAGPGGYHAAIRGAQLGLRVAVVERDDGSGTGGLGGVCLNWGCIPSKALLEHARLVNQLRDAPAWGIKIDTWEADLGAAMDRSRRVSAQLTSGIGYLFRKHDIALVAGHGRLTGAGSIQLDDGTVVEAPSIVIATGARARSLPGLELDGTRILSSRQALELRERPDALAIVGASAIGCEFAYFFNAYGVEVRLFEILDRIVPKEDAEVSAELARRFAAQGISAATGATVEGVDERDGRLALRYRDARGATDEFVCDRVLLGVGIQPNSDDIGLDTAGVKTDEAGFVEIDGHMRTNVDGVYAVGDVTGKLPLAHVAFEQGVIAAEMAAGEEPAPLESYVDIPRCTYCAPQIASMGLTESEARAAGIDVRVGKVPFQVAGKAVAIGEGSGFAKILIDNSTGEIVGAHLIGPDATELIAEIGMAKLLEATNVEVAHLVHAHPTLSEVVKEAAAAVTGEAIHY